MGTLTWMFKVVQLQLLWFIPGQLCKDAFALVCWKIVP